MPWFHKRPIEARQYTGTNGNWLEITQWAGATLVNNEMVIYTNDGERRAYEGDWIVKGEHGFYPMSDEVFRMIYEPQEPGGPWD